MAWRSRTCGWCRHPLENRTVKETEPPRRPPNRELREREHLTDGEVERLIEAARDNRHGYRDALMILMAYRHGLRAAEVTDLKWEQVDFDRGELHVNRLKGGMESTHPLTGRELRELRKHKRYSPPSSRFVFVSERGAPLSAEGFNRMIKRAGSSPVSGSRCTPTCSATPAASNWPMTGSIPGRCRLTLGTAISRTPPAIRRWRRGGLRTSGETSGRALVMGDIDTFEGWLKTNQGIDPAIASPEQVEAYRPTYEEIRKNPTPKVGLKKLKPLRPGEYRYAVAKLVR